MADATSRISDSLIIDIVNHQITPDINKVDQMDRKYHVVIIAFHHHHGNIQAPTK